jgi:hypothetical protein
MNKLASLVFCLAVAFIIPNDGSAQGYGRYGYNLGGVNLNYYCSTTFGAGFKSVLIDRRPGIGPANRASRTAGQSPSPTPASFNTESRIFSRGP